MNITDIKHQLRRTRSALLVAGALLALPSANADAQSNGQGAHGSWTDCEHITNVTDYGSYIVFEYQITTTYTGTFDGTWEGVEEDVFYPDGYVTVHAEGTFTGSVGGRSGTVRISFHEAFSLGGFPHRPGGIWIVDKGTGDLAGLRGVGSRTVPASNQGTPGPGCDYSFFGTYEAGISLGP
jgi:Protein of unknown function (DUF3224)